MGERAPFRFRWIRGWPPKEDDYTASHTSTPKKVAHIFRNRSAKGDRSWQWIVFDEKRVIGSGDAPDALAAARAAEDAYFATDIAGAL
jgi:hypothetical protein